MTTILEVTMNSITPFDLRHAVSAHRSPVHEYVAQNWPALRNAAALLGGQRAAREADRLFDDLATQVTIGLHAKRRLERMIRRLKLDDDIVSEDVLLDLIDPSDPVVDELCLLCDGLRHASEQTELSPGLS
jgi:hypothetical protein